MDSRPPAPPPPDTLATPPRRRRRWPGALLAVVLVAAAIGGSWYLINRPAATPGAGARGPGGPGGGFGGAGGRSRGPTVTVGVATAKHADIPVQLDALGTVTPVTTVTLRPQVAGVMTEVLFQEGQTVRKGDLLARIDPRPFEQALMQAQGTRTRDEAQLQAARVTLERFRTLQGQDSIAVQDVDTQAALVKQLEGTVQSDKANEAAAKLNLDYTRITAPVAGRIGLRAVDPGNYVSSGATTGIAVITQMNPIDVAFSVPQDRVPDIQGRVAQGAKLSVTAYDRTRTTLLATGTFSTLDNVVDITTGTVKAKARFSNDKGTLFPSQFVNIRLLLRTLTDAVVVPVTALRTSTNGNYVYVINENRTVSQRPVKRGDSTVESVVITEGLKDGERVVTEGGDRLKDGARVQLPGDAPRTPGAGGGGFGERRRNGASAPAAADASAPRGNASAPEVAAPRASASGASGAPASASAPTRAAAANGSANRNASAANAPRDAGNATPAPAANDAAPAATSTAAAVPKPTPEQRQRLLDSAHGDAEQLARRQRFLDAIDRGDPEALERWQAMQQRRREGGGGGRRQPAQ